MECTPLISVFLYGTILRAIRALVLVLVEWEFVGFWDLGVEWELTLSGSLLLKSV
jgi:hypothetical protein